MQNRSSVDWMDGEREQPLKNAAESPKKWPTAFSAVGATHADFLIFDVPIEASIPAPIHC
jgi:hypothetical protein